MELTTAVFVIGMVCGIVLMLLLFCILENWK